MSDSILEHKRVLVAEDNAINQMVIKHTLLKLGASADIAGDGSEAIEKFKNSDYDLILMDVQMPLMDGYETTVYIRKQLQSNVPIIAMTAFALSGEDEKCYQSGMNGYVSKPFTIDSLDAAVQKVLQAATVSNSNPYLLTGENVAVDISMLYDISGNNESYIQAMVHTFLSNMPKTLQKIDQSLQAQDWEQVYKNAHHTKSSLSVIKIIEIFDWVFSIEQNAKAQTNLTSIPDIFNKVKLKFKLAEQVLLQKFPADSLPNG